MPQSELFILMGMGGLFILLGLGSIIWGRGEERSYYDTISARPDLQEFANHTPPRPEHGALKIGGRIALIIGGLMLVTGLILLLLS